jgi:general secretion pathway protein J
VRAARGMTLVEVLIAVGITAGLGMMTLGAFQQVDRANEIVREQSERTAAARVALTRLARELSMAYLSDHFDPKRFRERPTLFVGEEDEILFSTMAHERLYRDAKESDQAIVEYTVESDPDRSGEEALFRREKVHLDDQPDRGGRKDLVADRVTGFRLQYWDPQKKEWVREWSTRSIDHANALPVRVRIELEVGARNGPAEKFVTEARIALTQPLDF